MGEVIAVLSGKGGTGKTTLCAGIATALAQDGEKVLCIDCDVGLRNLDIALGLTEGDALSFLEVCRGEYTLEQAMTLFEEGAKLLRDCTRQLDEAEQTVVKLQKGPDGSPVELPFDTENE